MKIQKLKINPIKESTSIKTFGAKGKKLNETNEAFDVDKVKKRIARTDEFDNGHVLFNYERMTSDEAEEKAKQKSIENPNKVFYVSYDDIMEPSSDIKWKNGKQLKESIDVETIADYITDHYDFDDVDDKYACINSIKDSHKDTISEEELEQFIGSHNGKDKLKEFATHCVYFTQDGIDQIEFEGSEDECNRYISDIQAEQDDEFGDEAPERFIKRINEAYEVSDEDAVRDWAKDCKEMGYGVEDYKEFASILKDEGIIPTQELYQIYLDAYNSSEINESVEMPYMFHYNCNNPTYGYDFQQFASKLGAKKVYGKWQGKGQGRYFYLVPSEYVYNELKAVAKDKYTVDMQKMLPYSEEDYPNVEVMKESFDKPLKEVMAFGKHIIKVGDDLVSKSGHKIHINDITATLSPFEKNAIVTFDYSYETTDGETGSSTCTTYDLVNMLNESLKEDYSDDIITLSRYLDVEVPNACENMLELIENLPTNKVNFLTNVCRAFIEKLNRTIEHYTMIGDDFDESLSEASYGGAFDIADDQYFTREDLDSFSEEVLNHINETFKAQFDVSSCYIDNGVLEIGVTNDKYGDYIHSEKIDMRKIKEPWHLKKVYAFDFATNLINDIVQTNDGLIECLNESMSDAQPIEAGAAVGMASVINDLIKDEYEAIDGYNSAIATAQAEGFEDAVKLLTDIQAEENLHVGQLQEVMKLFDPNADKVEDGQVEGAEQIANPLGDDDLSDNEFTEALNSMDKILEGINKSTDIPNNNIEDINLDELEEEVVVDMQEAWEDIYKSFKDIETQLNGDGEAITATIDRLRDENKGNPDFEKAYDKWASGN